ncbi:MAG: thioredoxin domain-containing protein [Candidatus Microgenomates bacterium]|jgi:protein-disulfide isomerase
MIAFLQRNKIFIFIVLVTCILCFGGIVLFSNSGNNPVTPVIKIDRSILVPQGANTTSGIINGQYLPATPSATISIVEFGDYECPACGTYNPIVTNVLTTFADKVNFTFRDYPLSQHSKADISSYAADAAGLQGKFWQMHDKLYANQNDWVNASDTQAVFDGYAKELGLDVGKFDSDMNGSTVKDIVQKGVDDGNTVGLTETPTFYLNGQKINLSGASDQLLNAVQSALIAK